MFENSNVLKGYLICSAKTCWEKYHILLLITKVVIYAGGIVHKQNVWVLNMWMRDSPYVSFEEVLRLLYKPHLNNHSYKYCTITNRIEMLDFLF